MSIDICTCTSNDIRNLTNDVNTLQKDNRIFQKDINSIKYDINSHAEKIEHANADIQNNRKRLFKSTIMNYISVGLNCILICITVFNLITNHNIANDYNTLNDQYSEAIVKYDDILTSYNEINDNYDQLVSIVNELDTAYQNLIIENKNLSNEINSIKDSVDSINESLVAIANEVEINLEDIAASSNLDADTFNYIINRCIDERNISDSMMKNTGEFLVKMEAEYNVNGLFCLAICVQESGFGTSKAAIERNNLFGFIRESKLMYFDTVEDCIMFWGKLLRNFYIDDGLDTIDSIQDRYCPGSTTWADDVTWLFNNFASYV